MIGLFLDLVSHLTYQHPLTSLGLLAGYGYLVASLIRSELARGRL